LLLTKDHFVATAISPGYFVIGEGTNRGSCSPLFAAPEVPAAYHEGEDEDTTYCYTGDRAAS
jgi:hypothetical protein